MTLASTLFAETRTTYLLAGRQEQLNRLNTSIDANDTSVVCEFAVAGIQPGARITIGLEDFYVWAVESSSKTLTVERAWNGTTAASATAGAIIRVNPRWSDAQILTALNDELVSLFGRGLYRMRTTDITYQPGYSGFALPADCTEVYMVSTKPPDGMLDWRPMTSWQAEHNLPTTDFASGNALFFTRDWPDAGMTARVHYKAAFGSVAALTDVVETVTGLPAMDVLRTGIAIRLTEGLETARNLTEAQPAPRRSEEVVSGAAASAGRWLIALHARHVADEKVRLAKLYPPRRR